MNRVYLDWNATAPLRPEARAAMLAAMDCLGNPSSVHAEGRAAKAIVEKARGQVADLVGCDRDEVVFTSGATEAARLVVGGFCADRSIGPYEHDAVNQAAGAEWGGVSNLIDDLDNRLYQLQNKFARKHSSEGTSLFPRPTDVLACLQHSNSETGIIDNTPLENISEIGWKRVGMLRDTTQSVGKLAGPFSAKITGFAFSGQFEIFSAHKFGGTKGNGAVIMRDGSEFVSGFGGSGQEKGRRSGTENVVGIAGMGAAAEAAAKDLADGVWLIVEQNRNVFEERLLNEVPELIIFGKDVERLPNTSYFAVPGWKAETQVMQMDLAGFAVSAGSACSSGKVKASRVLKAMGYDEITAGSAIRVSIGPSTTAAELDSFADAWLKEYKRFKARR